MRNRASRTPIPLVYPQVVFLAVRAYFFICLIARQHITHNIHSEESSIDPIFPIKTMVEFFVFIGWMKVAEALLNPLGIDDDDIEVNYILDKNLITGFKLVDHGGTRPPPPLKPDVFYKKDPIAPLYSLDAAKRDVYPLIGSASTVNLVKSHDTITMVPHKNQLSTMTEEQQADHIKVVSVEAHNKRHKTDTQIRKKVKPDEVLAKVRKRAKKYEKTCFRNKSISETKKTMFKQSIFQFLDLDSSINTMTIIIKFILHRSTDIDMQIIVKTNMSLPEIIPEATVFCIFIGI